MRLGGYFGARDIGGLNTLCEEADKYGFSAIVAPDGFTQWKLK